MQIAVLSDLHLGKKDKLDQFYRNPGAEEKLENLFEYLESHVDKIILLGDVFETLRGKSLRNREKQLKDILKCYPKITQRILEDPAYVLLQGNHDTISGPVLNAREALKIKDNGVSMCFFHGHQVDPKVGSFWIRHFEKTGVWLGGWLERAGLDVTKKGNLSSKFKALNGLWKKGLFEEAAVAYGKEMGGDIIITGHSHHPMKIEIDGALFLNSGTRVAGRQDFALLDTATREYEVYKAFDSSSQN